jgi:hypothetical protein
MKDLETYLNLAIESQRQMLEGLEEDSVVESARRQRNECISAIRERGVTVQENEALRDKINLVVRLDQQILERAQASHLKITNELNGLRKKRKMVDVYASA